MGTSKSEFPAQNKGCDASHGPLIDPMFRRQNPRVLSPHSRGSGRACGIDLGVLPVELTPKAFEHLVIVAAMFGNRRFPEWETIPRVTIDALGPELGPKIMAIVAEHIEIVDHIPGPNMSRNKPVTYQFAERLPLPTLALEHVRRPIDRVAIAKEADLR